jgi:hypothetical protein
VPDTIDTSEAVRAKAKTSSRKEAAECTFQFKVQLDSLLKDYEGVVPVDPDFKFPFPPKRTLDFEIKTIPHGRMPSKTVFKMKPMEREELSKQLDELIARDFIRPSQSAYGSPVLFEKRKVGALRMCVIIEPLTQ